MAIPAERTDANRRPRFSNGGMANGSMADLPVLPPDSWARIEIVKNDSAKQLRERISFIRSSLREGEDEFAYFHQPLCFAYADYIADVFFANLDEYTKSFGLPRVLEEI